MKSLHLLFLIALVGKIATEVSNEGRIMAAAIAVKEIDVIDPVDGGEPKDEEELKKIDLAESGLSERDYNDLGKLAENLEANNQAVVDFVLGNKVLQEQILGDPNIAHLMEVANVSAEKLFSADFAKQVVAEIADELKREHESDGSEVRTLQSTSCWAQCDSGLCSCVINNPLNAPQCLANWGKCKLRCECQFCRDNAWNDLQRCLARYPRWWQFAHRALCRIRYALHLVLCRVVCALAG